MAEAIGAGDDASFSFRQQSAYRDGYRTGFVDGFDKGGAAVDRQNERGKDKAADSKSDTGRDDAKPKDPDKNGAKNGDEKNGDDKHGGDKPGDDKPPIYKRPLVVLIAIVVVIALIVAALLFWRRSREHEKTDDAFIDGQASRIAAQVAGRVSRLYVTDNQEVKAGDPLIDIDTSDIRARVDQARAQLATQQGQVEQAQAQLEGVRANAAQSQAATRQAEADSTRAAQNLARIRSVDPDAVSRRQADEALAESRSAIAKLEGARSAARAATAQIKAAQAQVQVARAGVDTARANGEAAELQLSYAHVVAPVAGRVTRRSVDLGNVVSIGQPILSIVSRDLWVTANYKETQLTEMRVGQPVDVVVDAFPKMNFSAHVDSIQRGTGSFFSQLPAENATGNYVKVVQRVPVKIVFDRPDELTRYAIGPGMSVTPDVHLR